LVKNGTGYWALSGALSHTGPTTVEQGSLRLEAMSHDNTNTGNISVATGAVLELVTSAATPRRVTGTGNVTVNGTLRTGASGTGTGTARYGGGLTFNTNSVLELGAA
jgi:autotransporter-associated beta strand protein